MAYVLMAVPAALVPAVSEFIENQESPESSTPDGPAQGGFVNGWDGELVARAYRESGDRMRQLLRFLASKPGVEVSASELAASIQARYGWNTVAGMFGALGRRSANRYARRQPMWTHRHDDSNRILITMPEGPARVIRDLASR